MLVPSSGGRKPVSTSGGSAVSGSIDWKTRADLARDGTEAQLDLDVERLAVEGHRDRLSVVLPAFGHAEMLSPKPASVKRSVLQSRFAESPSVISTRWAGAVAGAPGRHGAGAEVPKLMR
jgi:hypothetical protein